MKLDFAIDGITELVDFLEKDVPDEVFDELRAAVDETAEQVLQTAQENCPVDSGLLKSTMHKKTSKSGLSARVQTDEKNAPHGHLVHYGTVRQAANDFLYRASNAHQGEFIARVKKIVGAQ